MINKNNLHILRLIKQKTQRAFQNIKFNLLEFLLLKQNYIFETNKTHALLLRIYINAKDYQKSIIHLNYLMNIELLDLDTFTIKTMSSAMRHHDFPDSFLAFYENWNDPKKLDKN